MTPTTHSQAVEAAVLEALPQFKRQDDYLLAGGASLMSYNCHEILHMDTLRKIIAAIRAELTRPQAKPSNSKAADARREIGKWLNEGTNKPVDREALAQLCAGFDALARSQEVAAEVGDEYLCRAWGETDMPVVAIVVGLDAVRQFLIDQWLGDENDTDWCGDLTLPPIMTEISGRDWRGEGAWSAEFEIGGISVEQVCDVGPPAAASRSPAPAEVAAPVDGIPAENVAAFAKLGLAMYAMTTTIHSPNIDFEEQLRCVPEIWQHCMEERDALTASRVPVALPAPSIQELAAGAFYPQVTGYATPAPKGDAKDARPDSFHSDSGDRDRVQAPGPTDAERLDALEAGNAGQNMWIVARGKDSFTVALKSPYGNCVTRKTLRAAIDAAILASKPTAGKAK